MANYWPVWLLSLFFPPSLIRTAFIFDYNCAWMKGYFRCWHGTFSSHMISHAHNYANFYILELHHFIKPSRSQRLLYCIYFNAKHVKLIGELIVLVDRKQFPKTPTSYINLVSTVTKKKKLNYNKKWAWQVTWPRKSLVQNENDIKLKNRKERVTPTKF